MNDTLATVQTLRCRTVRLDCAHCCLRRRPPLTSGRSLGVGSPADRGGGAPGARRVPGRRPEPQPEPPPCRQIVARRARAGAVGCLAGPRGSRIGDRSPGAAGRRRSRRSRATGRGRICPGRDRTVRGRGRTGSGCGPGSARGPVSGWRRIGPAPSRSVEAGAGAPTDGSALAGVRLDHQRRGARARGAVGRPGACRSGGEPRRQSVR